MVSVKRAYTLTPGGELPTPRLRYTNPRLRLGNRCDTVAVEWCDRPIPWKGCVSCKICLEDPSEGESQDFACRCRQFQSDCRTDLPCCKKRRGCVCRKRKIPDCGGTPCQCTEIPYDLECERAVRAVRAERFAAARRQWRPSGASTIRRTPGNGVPAAPDTVQHQQIGGVHDRFTPSRGNPQRWGNGRDPLAFAQSLWCNDPPTANGLSSF